MKTSSGQESHDAPGLQKAQGCMATNLAVPGLGSLVGGRKVGLLQMVLYFSGFAMTIGSGSDLFIGRWRTGLNITVRMLTQIQ